MAVRGHGIPQHEINSSNRSLQEVKKSGYAATRASTLHHRGKDPAVAPAHQKTSRIFGRVSLPTPPIHV